jgi:hypothetical protein
LNILIDIIAWPLAIALVIYVLRLLLLPGWTGKQRPERTHARRHRTQVPPEGRTCAAGHVHRDADDVSICFEAQVVSARAATEAAAAAAEGEPDDHT